MNISSHSNGTNAHVLLVSYTAQGHVAPFMKLSHLLSSCGTKVTLVITESKHARIVDQPQPGFNLSMPETGEDQQSRVRIVSVPNGLEPEDERKDVSKLIQSINRVMPGYVEELIKKINHQEGDEKITSAPGSLALTLQIPKFIQADIINPDGTVRKNVKVELLPNLSTLSPAEFAWNNPGHPSLQEIITSVFNQHQFNDLALGLELVGRPFLWVVGPELSYGNSCDYPNGSCRVWPISEGWFGGHLKKSCICDGWKVGLCLNKDENGVITKHEIKRKVEEFLSSDSIRKNAINLKNLAQQSLRPGGSSSKGLQYFVNQIKA
ncbi:hypothetical protein EZV62_024192 [Acer yangbiense]|uniref:Uncharacterized protein n=1 Tax=Acer yangbiense TaxID=1000413 RepID=A0A5C7H3W0_9ROSI|nr:hypothetical protein EZV62_024192 [Acer yangbiense]